MHRQLISCLLLASMTIMCGCHKSNRALSTLELNESHKFSASTSPLVQVLSTWEELSDCKIDIIVTNINNDTLWYYRAATWSRIPFTVIFKDSGQAPLHELLKNDNWVPNIDMEREQYTTNTASFCAIPAKSSFDYSSMLGSAIARSLFESNRYSTNDVRAIIIEPQYYNPYIGVISKEGHKTKYNTYVGTIVYPPVLYIVP